MRTRLLFLLPAILLSSLLANANEYFHVENSDGVTIYYSISSSNTVTVTSNGYGNSYSGIVRIPNKVVNPDDGKVYTVTAIGGSAFYECTSLTHVGIPETVTRLGVTPFYDCTSLKEVIIPPSVCYLDGCVFYGCYNLKKVAVPSSFITPEYLFTESPIPHIISYPVDGVIDNGIVYSSDKSKLYYVSTTKTGKVDIPSSVKEIESYAFGYCEGVTGLSFPKSLEIINYYSFEDCTGITSITIPDSVKEIRGGAFSGCSGLESIDLGNGVRYLDMNAFGDCIALKEVIIPGSVKNLNNWAFSGCGGVEKCACPEHLLESDFWLADGFASIVNVSIVYYPTDCIIEDGIGYNKDKTAIYYVSLFKDGNFDIPNTVTEIGRKAFCACRGLTSVSMPATLNEIGSMAFSGCSSLESIEIPYGVTSIEAYTFAGCSELSSVFMTNSVREIGEGAFSGCGKLKSVVLPPDITSISARTFASCGLTSIDIPNKVVTIGDLAFYRCESLSTVVIPSSVVGIGESAFYYCRQMEYVEIPNSVVFIGEYAFGSCYGLKTIYAKSKHPEKIEMGTGIFSYLNKNLVSLYVPTGYKDKYQSLAQWCDFQRIYEMNFDNDAPEGDTNGDGVVDAADIAYLVDGILGIYHENIYIDYLDINGDSKLDATDISYIIKIILSY